MQHSFFRFNVLALLLFVVFPPRLNAASVLHKAIFTFGELNKRSGVLFAGRAAEIFQKNWSRRNRRQCSPSGRFVDLQTYRLGHLQSEM